MGDASEAGRRLTARVLKSYSSIEESRLQSLVLALIRHLHAYIGETKLTDQEWEYAWNFMGRMAAVADRNEFLLAGDVLGVSQLIETLNHDRPGQSVGFALVGPFLRADAPFRKRGDSIASAETPGARVRVSGKVFDVENGEPLAGAVLDVWQAATNGLYENQDENQADYNLRGRFETDRDGSYEFVALMPTAYPVPTDGPIGELLRVAERWAYRPAHIHVIASFPDHETLVTQIFKKGDEQTADDCVFTASENMMGDFMADGDRFRLQYDFPLKRGISMQPKAPIAA